MTQCSPAGQVPPEEKNMSCSQLYLRNPWQISIHCFPFFSLHFFPVLHFRWRALWAGTFLIAVHCRVHSSSWGPAQSYQQQLYFLPVREGRRRRWHSHRVISRDQILLSVGCSSGRHANAKSLGQGTDLLAVLLGRTPGLSGSGLLPLPPTSIFLTDCNPQPLPTVS